MFVKANMESYRSVLIEFVIHGRSTLGRREHEAMTALQNAVGALCTGAPSSLVLMHLQEVNLDKIVDPSVRDPAHEIYHDVVRYLKRRYDIDVPPQKTGT